MSALLRALMDQQLQEIPPSGLVVVSEFTQEVNSMDSRKSFPLGLQAKLESGKKYHISFDIKIKSIDGSSGNYTKVTSHYPDDYFDVSNWGYCGRGIYAGFEKLYHFEKTVTCTKSDTDGSMNDIFQYDSSGAHAIFKAFNFTVEEVSQCLQN